MGGSFARRAGLSIHASQGWPGNGTAALALALIHSPTRRRSRATAPAQRRPASAPSSEGVESAQQRGMHARERKGDPNVPISARAAEQRSSGGVGIAPGWRWQGVSNTAARFSVACKRKRQGGPATAHATPTLPPHQTTPSPPSHHHRSPSERQARAGIFYPSRSLDDARCRSRATRLSAARAEPAPDVTSLASGTWSPSAGRLCGTTGALNTTASDPLSTQPPRSLLAQEQ